MSPSSILSYKNNIDFTAREQHDDTQNINKGVSPKYIPLQKQGYVALVLNKKQFWKFHAMNSVFSVETF